MATLLTSAEELDMLETGVTLTTVADAPLGDAVMVSPVVNAPLKDRIRCDVPDTDATTAVLPLVPPVIVSPAANDPETPETVIVAQAYTVVVPAPELQTTSRRPSAAVALALLMSGNVNATLLALAVSISMSVTEKTSFAVTRRGRAVDRPF